MTISTVPGTQPDQGINAPTRADFDARAAEQLKEFASKLNLAGGIATRRVGQIAMSPQAMEIFLQVPRGHRITRMGYDFDANAVRVEVEGPTMPAIIEGSGAPVLAPLHVDQFEDGSRRIRWPAAPGTETTGPASLVGMKL